METNGFEGAMKTTSAPRDRLERRREPGARALGALVADVRHFVRVPAARRTRSGSRARPAGVVRKVRTGSSVAGRSRTATPSALGEPARRLRERHALAQQPRADEMEADVAVSQREPDLRRRAARPAERVRRLVADAPAALLVEEPGQRVEDGVEVGRDVQAEELDVVADVDDRRHLLGAGRACERVHEPRAAQAAAENG